MIKVIPEPNTSPLTWKKFVQTKPSGSIALDGYVQGGPRFKPGSWANFNHHEGVSRLETRATCAQVLIATRMGLLDAFRDELGQTRVSVFVNDCDEDVCLSSFILNRSDLCMSATNPALNRLVNIEDMLDTTAGMYPFSVDMAILRRMAWVFDPYRRFRVSGQIDARQVTDFAGIIKEVESRVMAHLLGATDEIPLDTRYEVLGRYGVWTMVREIGPNARLGMGSDKVYAFVSVRERADGCFTYSLGRAAPFIMFPIPQILKALNAAEDNIADPWGGSDIIAGSPRASGSKLDLRTVTEIINTVIG